MSRLLAPGCRDNYQGSTRVSSSLHVFLFLARSPSHFCYLHRRFPATDAPGYPPAGVCVAENQRHTEDTRIQAGQIKRRLPGIIRNVARRGARTNQAASLFSAPEPAFLFSLSLFSFFSFPLSPFLFLFFFLTIPRRLARTARGTLSTERRRGISHSSLSSGWVTTLQGLGCSRRRFEAIGL